MTFILSWLDAELPWCRFRIVALTVFSVWCLELARADEKPLTLITEELIAQLSPPQRVEWQAYLTKSRELASHERSVLITERLNAPAKPAPSKSQEFEISSDHPVDWFASAENQSLAETIISFQTPSGGWSKAIDYGKGIRAKGMHWTSQSGEGWHYSGTFDNRSTTEQLKFLAGVYLATKRDDVKDALLKGIDYLFLSQFPNGGWPQVYPIERGYHEAITLNDNAMLHVLEVLGSIASKEKQFAFVDESLRHKAQAALKQGIACLMALQVHIDGKPTVWCAQHHPLTLMPVSARAKEPATLSGGESADIVKFLMRSGPTSLEVVARIESAIQWFESKRITNLRKSKNDKGKPDYIHDPNSTEVYWARFYDLESGLPVFAGSDDGIIYHTFSEMAAKNKVDYDYFTTRPNVILDKEVARWRNRLDKSK